MIKNVFIIIILGLFLACTKDSDVELPEYIPTVVVHCFISPQDSGVKVYVNLSKPGYNVKTNDLANVNNASVKITDGTLTSNLNFIPASNISGLSYYYIDSSNFKVIAGKTYQLTIKTIDDVTLSASTKIPDVVPIKSFSYKFVKNISGDTTCSISYSLVDPVGQQDFFKDASYLFIFDSLKNEWNLLSSRESSFMPIVDGELISRNQNISNLPAPSGILKSRNIDFRLYHLTREYYLYIEGLNNIKNTDPDPFAEPRLPFTNINGGLGVFAGYNYEQKIIKF